MPDHQNEIEIKVNLDLDNLDQQVTQAEAKVQKLQQVTGESVLSASEGATSANTPEQPPFSIENSSQIGVLGNGYNGTVGVGATLPPGMFSPPSIELPEAVAPPPAPDPKTLDPLAIAWEKFEALKQQSESTPTVAANQLAGTGGLRSEALKASAKDPGKADEWEKLLTAITELTRSLKEQSKPAAAGGGTEFEQPTLPITRISPLGAAWQQFEEIQKHAGEAPDVALHELQGRGGLQGKVLSEAVKDPDGKAEWQELFQSIRGFAGNLKEESQPEKKSYQEVNSPQSGWKALEQIQGYSQSAPTIALQQIGALKSKVMSEASRDSGNEEHWEKLIQALNTLTKSIGENTREEQRSGSGSGDHSVQQLWKMMGGAAIMGVGRTAANDVQSGNYIGAAGSIAGAGIGAVLGSIIPGAGTIAGMGAGAGIGQFIGTSVQGMINSADSARQYQMTQSDTAARFGNFDNLNELGIRSIAEWSTSGYKPQETLQMADTLRDRGVISQVGDREKELIESLQSLTRATGISADAMVNLYSSYRGAGGSDNAQEYMAQTIAGAVSAGMESQLGKYQELMGSARMQLVTRSGMGDEDDKAMKSIQALMTMLMGGQSNTSQLLRENPNLASGAIQSFLSTGAASDGAYGYDAISMRISGVGVDATSPMFLTPEQQTKNAQTRAQDILNRSIFSEDGNGWASILGISQEEFRSRAAADPNYLESLTSPDSEDQSPEAQQRRRRLQVSVEMATSAVYGRAGTAQDRQTLYGLANQAMGNGGNIPEMDTPDADPSKVRSLEDQAAGTDGNKARESIEERETAMLKLVSNFTEELNAMDKTIASLVNGGDGLVQKAGEFFNNAFGGFGGLGEKASELFGNVTGKIGETLTKAAGMFADVLKSIGAAKDKFSELFAAIDQRVSAILGRLGASIPGAAAGAMGAIGSGAEGLKDAAVRAGAAVAANAIPGASVVRGALGAIGNAIHDRFNDTPPGGVVAREGYRVFEFAPGDVVTATQSYHPEVHAEYNDTPPGGVVAQPGNNVFKFAPGDVVTTKRDRDVSPDLPERAGAIVRQMRSESNAIGGGESGETNKTLVQFSDGMDRIHSSIVQTIGAGEALAAQTQKYFEETTKSLTAFDEKTGAFFQSIASHLTQTGKLEDALFDKQTQQIEAIGKSFDSIFATIQKGIDDLLVTSAANISATTQLLNSAPSESEFLQNTGAALGGTRSGLEGIPGFEHLTSLPGAAGGNASGNAGGGAAFQGQVNYQTGTAAHQQYGDPRGGGRKHAGVDFDISGNQTANSFMGGVVTQVSEDPGGYGHYVDVYNAQLGVVERIAEAASINVKVGDTIAPGQAVGRGESETGVFHYEIRQDVDPNTHQGGYGFQGTTDPLKFLADRGIAQVAQSGGVTQVRAGGITATARREDEHDHDHGNDRQAQLRGFREQEQNAAARSGGNAARPAAAPRLNLGQMFEGGTNSLVARVVGLSEGTRTADGGKTQAWHGHTDPGNGAHNIGSFSYQGGATSDPATADRLWTEKLQQAAQPFIAKMQELGTNDPRLLFSFLDLYTQAPAAAVDRGGFIDQLPRIVQEGISEESIVSARVRSYVNPATGQLEAGGFGNDPNRLKRDQERRTGEVLDALTRTGMSGGDGSAPAPAQTRPSTTAAPRPAASSQPRPAPAVPGADPNFLNRLANGTGINRSAGALAASLPVAPDPKPESTAAAPPVAPDPKPNPAVAASTVAPAPQAGNADPIGLILKSVQAIEAWLTGGKAMSAIAAGSPALGQTAPDTSPVPGQKPDKTGAIDSGQTLPEKASKSLDPTSPGIEKALKSVPDAGKLSDPLAGIEKAEKAVSSIGAIEKAGKADHPAGIEKPNKLDPDKPSAFKLGDPSPTIEKLSKFDAIDKAPKIDAIGNIDKADKPDHAHDRPMSRHRRAWLERMGIDAPDPIEPKPASKTLPIAPDVGKLPVFKLSDPFAGIEKSGKTDHPVGIEKAEKPGNPIAEIEKAGKLSDPLAGIEKPNKLDPDKPSAFKLDFGYPKTPAIDPLTGIEKPDKPLPDIEKLGKKIAIGKPDESLAIEKLLKPDASKPAIEKLGKLDPDKPSAFKLGDPTPAIEKLSKLDAIDKAPKINLTDIDKPGKSDPDSDRPMSRHRRAWLAHMGIDAPDPIAPKAPSKLNPFESHIEKNVSAKNPQIESGGILGSIGRFLSPVAEAIPGMLRPTPQNYNLGRSNAVQRAIESALEVGSARQPEPNLQRQTPGQGGSGSPSVNVTVNLQVPSGAGYEWTKDAAKEGVQAAHDEFLERWEKSTFDSRSFPKWRSRIH